MTHLALIEYVENETGQKVPVVIVDYGPVTQDDFEKKVKDGAESQKDWVELFFLFHEMGFNMGVWDENGLRMPYTVGSGVKFLLAEIKKRDKGILPKEWHTGLKAMTLSGALKMLEPFMDEGDPFTFDIDFWRQTGDRIHKLLLTNLTRNPAVQQIPGLEKIKFLTDAIPTNPE
ncbi:hypothetical protein [Runella slithyformis]|uniref:Uncharacterized protein n=1 Tax=Runella slithyformis (strain ATCC 29530 / DSM 19594 / LMG 11500 / NCIMB 11436 / LSU 4) TaxID=761193 RepID=A0A7U4E4Q2_RUNSL|nr:hypothetical protein [Runella slithyformis]AEI47658.1 hypothetical protein Runsl_1230 [Runella slithyformis DSM 19594]